jgi:hypothetical protein
MAKKVLFEVEVDAQFQDLIKLQTEMDKLQREQKELAKNGQKNTAQFQQNKVALKELGAQHRATSKNINSNVKASRALGNSYNDLTERNRRLSQELRKLSDPLGKNKKRFDQISASIKRNTDRLKQMDSAMGRQQRNVGNYGSALKGLGGSLVGAATGALAVVGGLSRIISFGKQSIEAANQQAAAEKSLEVALGRRSQALLDQASALQKQTRFGDEATIQAQAYLAQMGLTEEQILKITPSILDFAEAQGISVADASKLLAKSLGSSTNALSRYGIEIEGAAGSNERLDSAVEALSSKFEGQAAAAAQVGSGALQQFQNRVGDLQEKIGMFIINAMNPMVSSSSAMGAILDDVSIGLDVLNGDFESANENFSIAAFWITALKNGFTLTWNVLKLLATPLMVAIELFGQFGDEGDNLESTLLDIQRVFIHMPEIISTVTDSIITTFRGLAKSVFSLGNLIKEAFDFQKIFSEGTSGIRKAFGKLSQDFSDAFGKGVGDIPEKISAILNAPPAKKEVENAGEKLGETLAKGMGKGFERNKDTIDKSVARTWADVTENQTKRDIQQISEDAQKKADAEMAAYLKEAEDIKAARQKTRQEITDASLQVAQQTADTIFQINQQNLERRKQYEIDQLAIIDERRQDDLQAQLDAGLISQAEYENNRLVLEEETAKKREEIERAAFNKQKKFSTAQALINGALAVTKILAETPKADFGIATAIQIGLATATTAAQIATIQSQKFAKGGLIEGASHEQGGVPFTVQGRGGFEAEGGEYIINKRATQANLPLLEAINASGLGYTPLFANGGLVPKMKFAEGGLVRSSSVGGQSLSGLADEIQRGIGNIKVVNDPRETIGSFNNVSSIENEFTI